ncbi:MAG: M81 family metallopeptidase [Thermoflexales bacterium]|nr:M81 family metallopeptidase [Thermoflexales bacterium]MDW8352457.1 M81 family metallopeptidase [Anaerolineae bacterium]
MRIAIGSFVQESQFFSPVKGSWQHFGPEQIARGQAMLDAAAGTGSEIAGAMDTAARHAVRLVPLLRAMSSASSAPIVREVYESIRDELLARLSDAMAEPVDGVLMVMHGAMSAEGYDDATGDVLQRVRQIVGPRVPLVATLDLHANITRLMCRVADGLVGYLTFPHVDMYETGARGMRLLIDAVLGRAKPVTVMAKLPMIVPAENAQTTHGVIHDLLQAARAHLRTPGMLDISIFPMQPWMDVPEAGCAVVVVADESQRGRAEAIAAQLADAWWRRKEEHRVELAPTEQTIAEALASERKPWVLADSADAPSSGAPGDSTVTLQALLDARPAKDCYTNIVDAPAVAAMIAAGVGHEVTMSLGARSGTTLYRPLTVSGRVRLISDGAFVHKGEGFHGATMHRGRTVVLQAGCVHIVVMERACIQWDPELYRSVGLEPKDAQIVIVKSPAGFRAAYSPFAAEIRVLDAPGVCTPNLTTLPYARIPRPMWPFDPLQDWRADGA